MPLKTPQQPSILITGAASGLGKATADLFRELNWDVVLFDKAQGDVRDEKDVQTIIDKMKNPRVCVNCAGILGPKKILSKEGVMPLDNFKEVIDINLIGSFNVMRLFAERLSKMDPLNEDGERGVIINTASIAAGEGQIGQTAYSASKAGIVGLTLPAARELSRFGIRVMAIAPGVMDTPMVENVKGSFREGLTDGVVFPKRLGDPKEFAQCVKHIIENQYLNGSVIRLDGGLRMG